MESLCFTALYLSVCISVCFYLCVYIYLCVPICMCLSSCVSISVCIYLCVSVCVCIYLCAYLSLCIYLSVCVSVSFSVCFFPCLFLCHSLSFYMSVSLCVSVSLCLFLTHTQTLDSPIGFWPPSRLLSAAKRQGPAPGSRLGSRHLFRSGPGTEGSQQESLSVGRKRADSQDPAGEAWSGRGRGGLDAKAQACGASYL